MMCLLKVVLSVLALQGGSFKIGYSFGVGFPAMDDEKAYADVFLDSGIDYELGSASNRMGLEAITDISESLRFRGSVSMMSFKGDHTQTSTSWDYISIWTIFSFGIIGSSRSDETMIWVDDVSTEVEASVYYKIPGADWISVGGGPVLSFTSRTVNTIYSRVRDRKTGLGLHTGVRLDQRSGSILGLPIVFGGEIGYRFQDVTLDGAGTGSFSVDFTGPVISAGTYLNL